MTARSPLRLPSGRQLLADRSAAALAVALVGLLAAAWWPHRVTGLLSPLMSLCGSAGTPACDALAGVQAELDQQGLGLQLLLAATALWAAASFVATLLAGRSSLRDAPAAAVGPDAAASSAAAASLAIGGLAMLCETGRLFAEGLAQGPVLSRSLTPVQSALGARTVALWFDDRARQALGCAPMLCSHGAPALTLANLLDPAVPHPAGLRVLPPGPNLPGFVLTAPLRHGPDTLGVLIVEFEAGQAVDAARMQVAEAYAALATQAVAAVCSGQEERRMALMEERGAIAAELHDSLAQSLAYMKIQVATLQRGLDSANLPPELLATAGELRRGLSNAYRALRELIAAFRVRMGPGGLRAAVQDTIEELAQRGGLDIAFDEALDRCVLGVNEEFHVMQVIREALSNSVRHAGAHHAWVSIRPVDHRLEVTIDDDGQGLHAPDSAASHHGLGIMRERARSLGGELAVLPRPGGGTRVQLRFVPQSVPGGEVAA